MQPLKSKFHPQRLCESFLETNSIFQRSVARAREDEPQWSPMSPRRGRPPQWVPRPLSAADIEAGCEWKKLLPSETAKGVVAAKFLIVCELSGVSSDDGLWG